MDLVHTKKGIYNGYRGRYLPYIFLQQSGKQHNKLNVYLQNDFTTGDGWHPNETQGTLMPLYKYTKSSVRQHTTSE